MILPAVIWLDQVTSGSSPTSPVIVDRVQALLRGLAGVASSPQAASDDAEEGGDEEHGQTTQRHRQTFDQADDGNRRETLTGDPEKFVTCRR